MKNRVKEFRKKYGLTQKELSKISGVSRNTISALERNPNINISYLIMHKIAVALNKKVSTIFLIN